MVIPHLRVNYLTRNKWLSNNLEDRGYTQGGRPAKLLNLVCFVATDHSTELFKIFLAMDLCSKYL